MNVGRFVWGCVKVASEPLAGHLWVLMMSEAGPAEVDIEMANSNENNSTANSANAFPLARVKKIIKADKDVNLVAAEAVHLTSIATVQYI